MTTMKQRRAAARGQTAAVEKAIRACALECVREAGEVLLGYFGRITNPRQKESASSIVCDADLAAERRILKQIKARFPDHNYVAEESGAALRGSEYTWVIDPLDGTSNFVAGLPWFGVMIGVLRGPTPIFGAMFLPVEDTLYMAAAGEGAYRNGKPVRVTGERKLQKVLCAFGFDPTPDRRQRRSVELMFQVAAAVRNTRATNSLVDFCYTVDGRLGGCVNLKAKIWDIAAMAAILPEAGGRFTDLDGHEIRFEVNEGVTRRDYAILGANPYLHRQLARITRAIK